MSYDKTDSRYIVYEFPSFKKRELLLTNFDDDNVCGILCFDIKAIELLKTDFLFVGCWIVNKNSRALFAIDILDDKICLFEGDFNHFEKRMKERLLPLNIEAKAPFISKFMFEWQFRCHFNCEHLYSYNLYSHIISDNHLLMECISNDYNFYSPSTYEDFCLVVKNYIMLFNIDYQNMDFQDKYKQLLYSLENRILINFSNLDLWVYYENFCKILCLEFLGDKRYE